MKLKEAELFEKIYPQFVTSHNEISILSKKSPDSSINKFKLNLINQLLSHANSILGNSKPFDSFEVFNDEDMNSNSDITYMLAQYIESLWAYKEENARMRDGVYCWILSDSKKEIRTSRYR